jgi:hypothetical protein
MEEQSVNIYDQFIDHVRHKQYPENIALQKHRILPGHSGGIYDEEGKNVVKVSYEDHCLAHYYRFLAYGHLGDLAAFQFMRNLTEEGQRTASIMGGKIGSKITNAKNKANQTFFYSKAWQNFFGDKGAGQRNVNSGHLKKLNDYLTKNCPEQRSEAGKLGGIACTTKQKKEKKHLFDDKALIQKKGNLKRWGIKIDGIQVPFDNLSSDFVDYHIMYGTQTSYINK